MIITLETKNKNIKVLILQIVYEVLRANGWTRSTTARELGLTERTIRNYIQEMKAFGWEVPWSDDKKYWEFIKPRKHKPKERKNYGSSIRISSYLYK